MHLRFTVHLHKNNDTTVPLPILQITYELYSWCTNLSFLHYVSQAEAPLQHIEPFLLGAPTVVLYSEHDYRKYGHPVVPGVVWEPRCSDFHMDDKLYLLVNVKTLQLRGQKEMLCMLWPQVLVRERRGWARNRAWSVYVCQPLCVLDTCWESERVM